MLFDVANGSPSGQSRDIDIAAQGVHCCVRTWHPTLCLDGAPAVDDRRHTAGKRVPLHLLAPPPSCQTSPTNATASWSINSIHSYAWLVAMMVTWLNTPATQ